MSAALNAMMLLMQLMPFLITVITTVINIDANHDGKTDGPEKLAAARIILSGSLSAFPSIASVVKSDPTKLDAIINAAVTLMNLIIK